MKPVGKKKRRSPKSKGLDTSERSIRRRGVLAILFLVALAFALGVYHITDRSLWYDEGVSIWVAGMPLAKMIRWTANDIQPPLYYLLLSGWMHLGGALSADRAAFWLRFFSLAWAVLTVPLLYRVTKRLLGPGIAFVAALLIVVSPMEVYYAQEGRMYTMLTFLILFAADRMLAILHNPLTLRQRQKSWLLLAVIMAAAMYTHYFAAFFLAAVWVYFALVWWKTGRKMVYLLEALMTIFVTVFLYSPWVPYLTNRFRVDTSYWAGTLKLHEALRHVIISLSLGETVLEPTGIKLMWGYVAIWFLGLALFLAVFIRRKKSPIFYPFWFLLLYQLLPLILVLVLTYRMPKFNPRYLMPILPAYLAWLAYASVAPSGIGIGRKRHSILGSVVSLVVIGYLFLTMAFSLRGLYFDPAFTKPDFRGAAEYIRQRIGPDETVILCSGHMFPVWNVYGAGLPQVRIPNREVVDARHPLGYGLAGTLNESLAGKRGVWIVLWQDDVADPNGYLLDFMERYGTLAGKADFWHVRVRHFRLPSGVHFSPEPPISHRLNVNFQGGLKLLGYAARDGGRDLSLFWQASRQLPDVKIAYWLSDENGTVWGRGRDRRPAAYAYPTDRWGLGNVVFGRFRVPAEPGTPPGKYRLCLRAYVPGGKVLSVLDSAGAPQGDYTCGIRLSIESLVRGNVSMPYRVEKVLAPGITLLGYAGKPPLDVVQGQKIPLDLFWKAVARPDREYSLRIGLGKSESVFPLAEGYSTDRWLPGDVVRSRVLYRVPAAVDGGKYTLELGLVDRTGRPAGPKLSMFDLKVAGARRNYASRPMPYPMLADFSGELRLLGMDRRPEADKLVITLEWQAESSMSDEWVGFVHALDGGGHLLAQEDHPLLADGRPTPGWLPGEVVEDEYRLPLSAKVGVHAIEVGVYRRSVDGLTRLPAYDSSGIRLGDSVVVPLDNGS